VSRLHRELHCEYIITKEQPNLTEEQSRYNLRHFWTSTTTGDRVKTRRNILFGNATLSKDMSSIPETVTAHHTIFISKCERYQSRAIKHSYKCSSNRSGNVREVHQPLNCVTPRYRLTVGLQHAAA
jgi:hypothetical protein